MTSQEAASDTGDSAHTLPPMSASTSKNVKVMANTSTLDEPLSESDSSSMAMSDTISRARLPSIQNEDSMATFSPNSPHLVQPSAVSDWWSTHPENPRNWKMSRKWRSTLVMSLYTLVSPLASTMIAPAIQEIALDYRITSATTMNLVLSIFLLAFAFGPLVLSPMSELWGRLWVLHVCNLVYLLFNVACALAPSTGALLAFRFLAGIGGSAPINIGGGVVTDLYDESTRTGPIAVYTLMTLLSPIAGPIGGGFLTQRAGYKWTFWLVAIVAGAAGVIAFFGLEETFADVVKKRVAKKEGRELIIRDDVMSSASSNTKTISSDKNRDLEAGSSVEGPKSPVLAQSLSEKPSSHDSPGAPSPLTERHSEQEHLMTSLTRPLALLLGNYICFALSLYSATVYGYLYLLFATFPVLFAEVYRWEVGVASLAYIGPGVGSILATIFGAILIDIIYKKLTARRPGPNGEGKPEYRLPPMIIGSIIVPAGLLWYGWSADKRAHWIHPLFGSGLFAAGAFLSFLSLSMYLVDTFYYAASALAAVSVLRSLFGFAFPLFGQDMFDALGIGPGYSLLAGISVVIGFPFPVWLFYYGENMRKKGNMFR